MRAVEYDCSASILLAASLGKSEMVWGEAESRRREPSRGAAGA